MSAPLMNETILLVDDDDLFRETLMQNFEDDGYSVLTARNGAEAKAALQGNPAPDGVVLDWNMPGENGLQVLRWMRDAGKMTPVLFLTGHNDQIYEEAALESGAADFVDKSRSYSILKKRLLLVLAARSEKVENAISDISDITVGDLQLRPKSKRAFWQGQNLQLTVSEFDIVHLLVKKPGSDIGFREMYDVVHGKDFAAGHGDDGYRPNVRTFVKRIRKKFREVDAAFDAIENYPGFGYRWKRN